MDYKYTDKEVILFDHILDLVGGSENYRCPTQSIFKKLIPLEVQRKTWGHEQNRIKVRISQALERIIEDGLLQLSSDKKVLGLTPEKGLTFYERGGYASDRERFASQNASKEAVPSDPVSETDREIARLRERIGELEKEVRKSLRDVVIRTAVIAFIMAFLVSFVLAKYVL